MKNQIKLLIQQSFLIAQFKLVITVVFSCFFTLYLTYLQVQNLSLETQNLVPLIEALELNQQELKNQLFAKEHQIKLLENTIEILKNNLDTLSYLNEKQNFDVFKKEVIQANTAELTKFYLKLTGIVVTGVLIFLLASSFKEHLFTETVELKFVDSVNGLLWSVKVPDNKDADLIIKKINVEDYNQVVEFVKTVVLKTSETVLRGAPDGVELVSSSVSVSERIIAASQITEVLSSTGIFGF